MKNIPTHDQFTGELNPHYEELTGKPNPLQQEPIKDNIMHTIEKIFMFFKYTTRVIGFGFISVDLLVASMFLIISEAIKLLEELL